MTQIKQMTADTQLMRIMIKKKQVRSEYFPGATVEFLEKFEGIKSFDNYRMIVSQLSNDHSTIVKRSFDNYQTILSPTNFLDKRRGFSENDPSDSRKRL